MPTTDTLAVVVRPKRSLLTTAVVTYVAITVPVFAVAYWYTAAVGGWEWILVLHILLALACLATLLRQTRVFAAVSGELVSGNGIFSRTQSVPRSAIARVVLARVYARDSSERTIQLVALDAGGRCLFRLRGQYWAREDLDTFAGAIGCQVVHAGAPLSQGEFFTTYPGSRYWFERGR
ncbi:hypothetical protein [Galbitalea soli]|uniref:Uncharacterized protein n=1 Tax=Galbitalea soli TaxID=1268042 RepID=A0A7C9PPA2_9MICO|nr:hypothetical protein [Galbitalea soli]NEM92150.1 hypothetical protein [Galbitalea soli]NYJ31897.1 hypothetical protein [Galbitalea soli]